MLLFLLLSFLAVRGKSPTYDEPLHAMGAWANLHLHDYRINFEDPPLWKYWAALPNSRGSIQFNDQDPAWQTMNENVYKGWELANRTLFQNQVNNGQQFINRSRFMMVLLGVALGIVLIVWAWQLAGPIAAMIAAGLYALDPNILGHAAMIKNDVPMGLFLLAVFYCCWRAGKQLTIAKALGISILTAIAVNTKFSALLLAPMLVIIFVIRAALPIPWQVLGRSLKTIPSRALASAVMLVLIAGISYFGIWASYGFRWDPSPDHAIQLNTHKHKVEAVLYRFQSTHPAPKVPEFSLATPIKQQIDELVEEVRRFRELFNAAQAGMQTPKISEKTRADINISLIKMQDDYDQYGQVIEQGRRFMINEPPPEQRASNFAELKNAMCRRVYDARAHAANSSYNLRLLIYGEDVGDVAPDGFIRFLNIFIDHHLLPSAWVHGVLFVHARSMIRGSYLLGETSSTGWWYYFPLAMLFKTPVGTILTLLVSAGLALYATVDRRKRWHTYIWPLACAAVPFVVFMYSAMSANLNIGMRHVLPTYPLMYLAAATLLAIAIRKWKKPVVIMVSAFGVLIAAETLLAYPNYIAYFNLPSSAMSHQGLDLLADSNLDWGQDLPLVAKWQQENPNVPLAFGPAMALEGASGSYFGTIDPQYYGIKSTPLYYNKPNPPDIYRTHVVGISATYLQGAYGGPFTNLRKETPIAVLGGSIYLYDLRPKQ